MENCPCGSEVKFEECCEPVIKGTKKADTAVQLMRARYSAYATVEADFLYESLHPDKKSTHDAEQTKDWAEKSEWNRLEIVNTEKGGEGDEEGTVEFIAHYTVKGERTRHHEVATFVKADGQWFFEDGEGVAPQQVVRATPKVGRNEPCPCGSGKKYKKCCGK